MMGQQQQGPVRFTPDELQEIAGELTADDYKKLHPDDQKVANEIRQKMGLMQPSIQNEIDKKSDSYGVDWPIVGALAGLAGGSVGLPAIASKVIPYGRMAGQGLATYAGIEAGSWALKKLGLPTSAAEMIPFMLMMGGGKGAGAAAPAEAASVEEALIKQGINPRNAGMAARGEKFPNPGKPVAPRAPTPAPAPPLVNGGEQALDVERRIFGPQGGEAATFGVRPPPYPPNVKTGASMDDIMEMLTGSSHGQGTAEGTPIIYNPAEKATRNANDRLKKKTARRTPK